MKRYPWGILAVSLACAACAGGGETVQPDAQQTRDARRADRAPDQATSGSAGGPCYGNGTCDPGLACVADVCVPEVDAGAPDLPSPDLTPQDGPVWFEARILDARVRDLPLPDQTLPDGPTADGAGKPCTTNAQCDDSLSCTLDVCSVNGCTNVPTNGCVIAGQCVATGAANAANECELCDPARSTTDWSNADEQGCDDGDLCTHSDACANRKCAGTAYSCDDGLDCTTDTCTGAPPPGECVNELAAGQCAIMGACVQEYATDPQAPCLYCEPTKPTDWTILAGSCFIDNKCHTHGEINSLNNCESCDAVNKPTTWSAATPTPSPHQVIVTEFLANPAAISDSNGEWIEIYNASAASIDLNGWTLKDEGIDSHIIQGPLVIAAGAYMVLAINANPTTNGGVSAAYQYSNFALSNLDDEIILIDSSCRPVDAVRYVDSTWDLAAGSSHALRDLALDNGFASNWCNDQPTAWAGSAGDKGTPGAASKCVPAAADAGVDTGPPPPDLGIADVNAIDGTGSSTGTTVPCVTTGVVLDEVAVGTDDYVGLHNRGTSAVSIVGYKIEMYGTSPTSPTIYTIKAADVSGPLAAGARVFVFEYSDGPLPGDINTGANIPFYDGPPSAALANAVALYDASNNLVDYWAVRDSVGKPPNVSFKPIAWPSDFSSSTHSFRRAVHNGTCPNFKYTDWGYGDLTR